MSAVRISLNRLAPFRPDRLQLLLLVVLNLSSTAAFAAIYEHPAGLSVAYPDTWKLAQLESNLLLTTPTVTRDAAGQPQEFVLLGAESVVGATGLADPAVLQFFDTGALQLLPNAQRISPPEVNGNTARLVYQTDTARLVVQYRFENSLGLYVAHRFEGANQHGKTVDSIFSTYRVALSLDLHLLGAWHRDSTSMTDVSYSADGGSSYASISSSRTFEFGSNHQVRFSSQASVYSQAESDGGGAYVSSTPDSADNDNSDYGTYTANGSQLVILWAEGDATTYDYNLFDTNDGPALKLVTDGGQPEYYRR